MQDNKKEIIIDFFKQILNVYEFELLIAKNENSEDIFKLRDIQGGNLGQIQQDEFSTLAEVIERLEVYHQDYIYESLENRIYEKELIQKNDWDLTAKRFIESDTIFDILDKIDVKEYNKIIRKNQEFTTNDMCELLNEDEPFYKSVCEKYVASMSKEMLLEINDKILHFYIEDEYIDLKNNSKINDTNYEQYLDRNFEVEEYNFYHELYYQIIKDNIAYDLNDLSLFDENGNWDFYISFEELKQAGYGFMVKDHYPLIEKYAVKDEKSFDFYDHFSLEQLDDFENSLHLYYETENLIMDQDESLISLDGSSFNIGIIELSTGMITYDDFIQDYSFDKLTNDEKIELYAASYFQENGIKDLQNYGADSDEGLYHLSSMYDELIKKMGIEINDIYTEDGISDGKYITEITFKDESKIIIDTSAWNGIQTVRDNLKTVYEYNKKIQEKGIENDNELEYDFE